MSPKLNLVSGRQLVKVFKTLGYEKIGQKGSHIKMKNHTTGSVAIIPDHRTGPLDFKNHPQTG